MTAHHELTPPPHDSMEEAQIAARWWPQEAEPVTARVDAPTGVRAEPVGSMLVLRITTAYEQGLGHANRAELNNPYTAGSVEAEAWDHGREVGARRHPAGDANMPVVAYECAEGVEHERVLRWGLPAGEFVGATDPLVRQRDAQAAIAALDARIAELDEALQKSGESVVRFSDAWASAQRRVIEVEVVLRSVLPWLHSALDRPPQTPEAKAILDSADACVGVKPCEPSFAQNDDVAAEYAETYARAQAQAAFWVWHALTHGRAPDMVPEEFLRPSGRITWLRDTDASKTGELMTPAELEEAYAASADEVPQLDHNWRTGQPADPTEVIDSMMRRKMAPQKLEWDDSSDATTGAGDR